MNLTIRTYINAPAETVWQAISDIENCQQWISAIKNIEILQRPSDGLTGLKWAETRVMFGKEVTETMWITEYTPGTSYSVQSESCGAIFDSQLTLFEQAEGVELSMQIVTRELTMGAKVSALLLGWLMKGQMEKALQQDLEDIKYHCEAELVTQAG